MKKLLLMTALSLTTSIVFAHENPDRKTTCYFFKNNKLQNKSTCILQSGGGAGGMYTNLKVGKKDYLFETNTMNEKWETYYYPDSNNSFGVIDYSRDPKTFKILKENQITPKTKTLYCQKTKDGKLDICYR